MIQESGEYFQTQNVNVHKKNMEDIQFQSSRDIQIQNSRDIQIQNSRAIQIHNYKNIQIQNSKVQMQKKFLRYLDTEF